MNTNNKASPSKSNKKKIRNASISVVLIIAIIAGIFAFLSATDTKTNVFTVGKVNVALREDDWYNTDNSLKNDDNNNGVPDFAEDILPGQKVPKAPYVENIGSAPANTYLVVGVPTEEWENLYTGDGTYQGPSSIDILVTTYAIQENYAKLNGSESIWNTYVSNTGIEKIVGEKRVVDENDPSCQVEIFEIFGLNQTDWKLIEVKDSYNPADVDTATSNMYPSKDGHNYYFFRYNNPNGTAILDAGAKTPELFTHVALLKDIGEGGTKPEVHTITYFVPAPAVIPVPPVYSSNKATTVTTNVLGTATNISLTSIDTNNISGWKEVSKITYQTETYTLSNTLNDDEYFEEGSIFDWMHGEIASDGSVEIFENAAYDGEIVRGNVSLFAQNTDISDGQTPADYLKYELLLDENGQTYATLVGAYHKSPNYPTAPTTVVVPQYLNFQYMQDEDSHYGDAEGRYYWLLNGYLGEYRRYQPTTSVDSMKAAIRYSSPGGLLPTFDTLNVGDVIKIPVKAINVKCELTGIYKTTPSRAEAYPFANYLVSVARKLVVPENVVTINYQGRTDISSALEEINIPRSCLYINEFSHKHEVAPLYHSYLTGYGWNSAYDKDFGGRGGISYHNNLTEVHLPNTLLEIPYGCFLGTSIDNIEIPPSVQLISGSILSDSSSQYDVINIPASVKQVSFFKNFANYNTIHFESADVLLYAQGNNGLHKNGDHFSSSNLSFDCTVSEFKDSLAYTSLRLSDISYYDTITFSDATLTASDRSYCSSCDSYYYPTLGDCLCDYYENAEIVYYKNHVVGTGNEVNCHQAITIKEGTTCIDYKAFKGYAATWVQGSENAIQEIILPASLKKIDNYAFERSQIVKINIPSDVASIGDYAFESCQRLRNITISNGVKTIGERAFAFTYNLENITIPDSIVSIGDRAFWNSYATITISQNTYNRIINNNPHAFDECRALNII